MESARRDSNDRVGLSVELNCSPDRVRRFAELSAPKSLTDDRNRIASRHSVFIGVEEPSGQRVQAED